jgi:wobble nucleotide-excising tRNase
MSKIVAEKYPKNSLVYNYYYISNYFNFTDNIITLKDSIIENIEKIQGQIEGWETDLNRYLSQMVSNINIRYLKDSSQTNSHQFIIERRVNIGTKGEEFEEIDNNLSEAEKTSITLAFFFVILDVYIKGEANNELLVIWIDDPIASFDIEKVYIISSIIYEKLNHILSLGQSNVTNISTEIKIIISTHHILFYNRMNLLFKNGNKKSHNISFNKHQIKKKSTTNIINKTEHRIKQINKNQDTNFIESLITRINNDKTIFSLNLLRQFLEHIASLLGYTHYKDLLKKIYPIDKTKPNDDNEKTIIKICGLLNENSHSEIIYEDKLIFLVDDNLQLKDKTLKDTLNFINYNQ